MANNSVGRNDRLYRKHRLALRDRVRLEGLLCAIPADGCPRTFMLELASPHRWSFTAHHPIPRSLGGDPDDPANMVPAHRYCNEVLGNRVSAIAVADPHSEEWPT